jgi:hydrogenase-4 component B
MQYTAGSFAGILTEWFAWILRPVRHGHLTERLFPKEAVWEEHTPETVLEHVVQPAGGVVMQLAMAARRVQHGTVQAYLLYVLIGLAVLAALALAGGRN